MKKCYKTVKAMIVFMTMLFSSQSSFAQILGWQFFDPQVADGVRSVPVSMADNGLSVDPLTLGAGLVPVVLENSYATRPLQTTSSASLTDIAQAEANDAYYEFGFTVKPRFRSSINALNLKTRASSGTRVFLVKYSINGGAFTSAAPAQFSTGAAGGNGAEQTPFDLSTVTALQNINAGTVVRFRLYYSGANNSTSTTALGRTVSNFEYGLSLSGRVEYLKTGAELVGWQFFNPESVGNETSLSPSSTLTGLISSPLTRGDGLRNVSSTNADVKLPAAFVANAKTATSGITGNIDLAIDNNLYFAFNVKPNVGYKISISKLNSKVRASAGGGKIWQWRYSLDDVTFVDLGSAYYNPSTSGGANMPEVDLSGITALQNVAQGSTIYFRLYVQGSNATTGSSGIGISFDENNYVLSLDGNIESTLPVKLKSFSGKSVGSSIQLSWQTLSEKDNSHFEVLRIQEGLAPVVLGNVKGNGSTSTLQNYNFKDQRPLAGDNFYQLRQVDFNGSVELSNIIAIKNKFSSRNFSVSLPDNGIKVFIQSENADNVHIKISDINGKTLVNQETVLLKGNNIIPINITLAKGVYIVSLVTKNNDIVSQKIIK